MKFEMMIKVSMEVMMKLTMEVEVNPFEYWASGVNGNSLGLKW